MDIVFLMVQNILLKMDHKIIFYFNHLLSILNRVQLINSRLDYFNDPKFGAEIHGSCLKTDSVGINHKRINLQITYKIKSWSYYT